MSKPNVTLCGLGTMGSGMAQNLLEAGYPLTVYNRSSEKTEPFAEQGADVASSPREGAEGADILISMVADDAASRAVWLGEDGALEGASPDALLIESSTLTVGWVRDLADAVSERGHDLLDAPVTGSKDAAASGALKFLVGGSEAAFDRARPVLESMSESIVHMGPTGSGALIKLINNFLCGVQAASLAEAVGWIEKSGLNRERALDVLREGAPGSPLLKTLSKRMEDQDYAPRFFLRLMVKDLSYALEEGEREHLSLATAAAARSVYERGVESGQGDEDLSAVVEQFREG